MAAKSLHEVLKPLLGFLDFSCVTWRREKSCLKRGLKMHNVFLWIVSLCLAMCLASCPTMAVGSFVVESSTTVTHLFQTLILINLFFTLVCHFRWTSLERLLDILKVCRMSPKISLKLQKIAFLALTSIAILFPIILVLLCFFVDLALNSIFYDLFHDHEGVPLQEIVFDTILGGIVCILVIGFVLFMIIGGLVLPILTLIVCCVVHYVHLTIEEALEKLKRCQSSSRRARMTTRIIELYDRLNQLIEPVNTIGDPLMFTQYVTAIYPFTIFITNATPLILEGKFLEVCSSISSHYIIILSLVIYLLYLRVSPKANSMRSLIAKELVETVLKDDQRLSRDPGSRTLLLKVIRELEHHVTEP